MYCTKDERKAIKEAARRARQTMSGFVLEAVQEKLDRKYTTRRSRSLIV